MTVMAGQVWRRPNGTTFRIEYCTLGYAHYWLEQGSRPQHRSIQIDRLIRYYRLVSQ